MSGATPSGSPAGSAAGYQQEIAHIDGRAQNAGRGKLGDDFLGHGKSAVGGVDCLSLDYRRRVSTRKLALWITLLKTGWKPRLARRAA